MSEICVTTSFAANPDTVWEVLGDPAALSNWHPAIASSEVEGDGRTCVLADGAVIRERILQVDADTRTYRYAIVDSPLPIQGYVSTFTVEADGAGSRVVWSSTFDAGDHAAEMEAMLEGVYRSGLDAARGALQA